MKKIITFLVAVLLTVQCVKADEGMWLPMFLGNNMGDMENLGLKLSQKDIYDVNNSSLKDAIVRLGGGFCTGEIISNQGLLLTNHHCGYGAIQSNSTVEHDYLTDGFWAMTKEEEIPAGFSVSFLVKMEDVTARMNKALEGKDSERKKVIGELSKEIAKELTEGTHYEAQVKSFYEGNEFYAFVYETFPDVRLVGAPPSSVGKYGGDTDNWMWPRHTGDFSMFRVYAGADNKPAEHSVDNKPFKPRHHLPVSLDGVKQGDFAMIFGYPGSTDRFLSSYGVKQAITKDQPTRVDIRRKKLDIYEEGMNADKAVRIQYATKHAQVSNYWKYFIGQTKGLKKLNVYEKKKAEEDAFRAWVDKNNKKEKYGNCLDEIELGYAKLDKYITSSVYLNEAVFGIESHNQVWQTKKLIAALEEEKEEGIKEISAAIKEGAKGFFKDYNAAIDEKVYAAMLEMYSADVPTDQQGTWLPSIKSKYKGNFSAYAKMAYEKSVFVNEDRFNKFLENPSWKTIKKDPVYISYKELYLNNYRGTVRGKFWDAKGKIGEAKRTYIAGLREMNSNKAYYPDANSTMRMTYGQVLDYVPQDAVKYNYFTTLEGVMEKEDPDSHEFMVPPNLKKLYTNNDYGQYGENGKLKVCFISNNDITGGNSGSPVINGKGELIGTAFDGNWEAMSGDIAFEPQLQRTISVDIRYTLFIIDKYAGASHLVDEMTLVKSSTETSAVETETKEMVPAQN